MKIYTKKRENLNIRGFITKLGKMSCQMLNNTESKSIEGP